MRFSTFACVALLMLGCKSDDPTAPVDSDEEEEEVNPPPVTGKKSLKILSGEGASDTVRAPGPYAALVVEVRGDNGDPVSGTIVRFNSVLSADTLRKYEAGMYVCPLTVPTCAGSEPYFGGPPSTFATATTGSDGLASVLVGFGTVAGTDGIAIEVPSLLLKDTAQFTVRPGNATRVAIFPRDTALLTGKTFTVRASAVDRYGNARSEPVSLSASNPAVASVSGTTVTTHAIGRSGLIATVSLLPLDSTSVSVVPAGMMAWGGNGIFVSGFDGSGFKKLATVGFVPSWVPQEDVLIYATGDAYSGSPHLAIVNQAGVVTNVPYSSEVTSGEFYPRVSRDGAWIYFSGRTLGCCGTWQLYRMRRDFTGMEMLSPDESYTDWRADVSPNGTQLVYVSTRNGDVGIRIMDIATRQSRHLTSYAQSPVWSPNGTQIAFVNGGLFVINPDGTGLRRVSPAGLTYSETVDWSADGQWLVSSRGGVVLVNVATGMEVRTTGSSNGGAAIRR